MIIQTAPAGEPRLAPSAYAGRVSLDAPIGIFDSGVGGLTVARAIMDQLPAEQVVYVGDTAHGPYGPLTPPWSAIGSSSMYRPIVGRYHRCQFW